MGIHLLFNFFSNLLVQFFEVRHAIIFRTEWYHYICGIPNSEEGQLLKSGAISELFSDPTYGSVAEDVHITERLSDFLAIDAHHNILRVKPQLFTIVEL